MDTKEKSKSKRGKAIIGIAGAAVMVASLMAMVPTVSARTATGAIESGDTLFIGEHGLHFDTAFVPANEKCKLKLIEDTTVVKTISIANSSNFLVPSTKEGGYRVYDKNENWKGNVTIEEPEITGNIFLKGTVDSIVGESIPVEQNITIRAMPNFGGLLKDAKTGNWGKIEIKLIDPDGVETVDKINASALEINIDKKTKDWDTGTYKVKIVSDKDTCNEVDVKSPEYEFTVRSEELSIEAVKDEVGKGEDIILKVSGSPKHTYYLAIENVVKGKEPEIQDTSDIKQLGTGEGEAGSKTAAWIKTGSDGVADIKIATTGVDERTYTIHVYNDPKNKTKVSFAEGVYPKPVDIKYSEDDDDVDVKVVEAKVTFDMPKSAIIGEKVTIKGAISAGDKVDILIDDGAVAYYDNEPVDEDKEFEVDWKTDGLTKGSYTVDVYIDCAVTKTQGYTEIKKQKIDEDGSTTIRLVEPGLTAKQPRNAVAEDDDYEIEGTATGVDDVDIVLIGPDGYPPGDPGLDVANGLYITSTSVTDDEFDEDIKMGGVGFDTGLWIAVVISPGRDGKYGDLGLEAGDLKSIDTEAYFAGKNRDQIKAILMDHTIDVAGSDDMLESFTFKVESAYVRLNPIASVGVGEPLEISGVTNREPETMITISTFAGPVDLPAEVVEVEWPTADEGVFNATIDTTDAVPGTYTIEADDGDGNTDTATVEIVAAVPTPTPVVSPTPTPVVSPTPTPVTPTPTPTPVETPTPTPKPPGFEAVFAIACLLAIAYLVLRKRRG